MIKTDNRSLWSLVRRELRRNVFGMAALAVFILVVLGGIFAPVLAPYDPLHQDLFNTFSGPSREHLLGTDALGRDLLSRLLYGARLSVTTAFTSVGFGAVVGVTLGLLSGFLGGWVDAVVMRVMDLLLSFPGLLLAILIANSLGAGLIPVTIAIGLYMIPGFARLARGEALSLQSREFVEAARAAGAGNGRILVRHILPSLVSQIIVYGTLLMGNAMLSTAALSFLGVGYPPPAPEWGSMINESREYIASDAYLIMVPGIALLITVLSLNILGDVLRDALDPKKSTT